MESRKAWRNRKQAAGEGVLALLEALRVGAGADSAGLFDDDRADPVPGPGDGALNFWDAFDLPACATIDWDRWYRELKIRERVETSCGCEAHRLCGYLIHGRWGLLLVVPSSPSSSSLPAGGAAVIASAVRALADKLPPARSEQERADAARYDSDATSDGDGGQLGAPAWWVRKLPQ